MAVRMRRTRVVLSAAVVLLALTNARSPGAPGSKSRPVKVMTRNLHLGADLSPAIEADSRRCWPPAPASSRRYRGRTSPSGPSRWPGRSDFRLVQHDAILVKAGLGDSTRLHGARSANFASTLVPPTGTGQQIPVKRGWTSVDATVNKRSFRFVNTHLEAFHPGIRLQQAQELLAPAGPIGSASGDAVLVGDLNPGPGLPVPADRQAYLALTAAGLVDTWLAVHPGEEGFTSGYGELLDEPPGLLEHRVDHVMVRGRSGIIRSRIYGTDPDNRTPSGMWPSDHAGVTATVTP